jgi:hypothetical protein
LETENPVQAFAEGTSYSEFSEKAMHRKRPEKQSRGTATKQAENSMIVPVKLWRTVCISSEETNSN